MFSIGMLNFHLKLSHPTFTFTTLRAGHFLPLHSLILLVPTHRSLLRYLFSFNLLQVYFFPSLHKHIFSFYGILSPLSLHLLSTVPLSPLPSTQDHPPLPYAPHPSLGRTLEVPHTSLSLVFTPPSFPFTDLRHLIFKYPYTLRVACFFSLNGKWHAKF